MKRMSLGFTLVVMLMVGDCFAPTQSFVVQSPAKKEKPLSKAALAEEIETRMKNLITTNDQIVQDAALLIQEAVLDKSNCFDGVCALNDASSKDDLERALSALKKAENRQTGLAHNLRQLKENRAA